MRGLAQNISTPSLLLILFNTDATYVSPAEQVSLFNTEVSSPAEQVSLKACALNCGSANNQILAGNACFE
jgi:hypothetical protein